MPVMLMRPSTEAFLPVTVPLHWPLHRERGPTVLCLLRQLDATIPSQGYVKYKRCKSPRLTSQNNFLCRPLFNLVGTTTCLARKVTTESCL